MKRLGVITILAFVSCFMDGFVFAQENSRTVETVVVTAGRMEEKVKTVTQQTTVVSREEIEKNQYQDIGQILRNYGIGVSGYGAHESLSQITIRGMRTPLLGDSMTSPILALVDGRRAGTSNVSMLPLVSIERIEIVRGASSAQYGSSAVGGVINIITRRGGKKSRVSAEAGYGSRDSGRVEGALSGSFDAVDYAGGVSWMTVGDSYKTGSGATVQNTDMDYRLSYVLNAGVNFSEEHRLGVSLLGVRADSMGSPGSADFATPEAFTDRFNRSVDFTYDGGYGAYGLSWKARYFHSDENYEYDDPASRTPFYDPYARAKTDEQGTQAQLSWNWDFLTLTGGFDWLENNYRARQDQSKSGMENAAGFLLVKATPLDEKLILSAGLRYDAYKLKIDDKERNLNHTGFSAGAAWNALDWLTFRANYGDAFRVPTGMETLGYTSQWANYLGDPDLEAEKGRSWDAGFEIDYRGLNLALSYFEIDYKNKIATRASGWDYQYYNISGSSDYRGIEGKASVDVGQLFDWSFALRPYVNLTNLFQYDDANGKKLQYVRDLELAYGMNFLCPEAGLEADLRFIYLGVQRESRFDPATFASEDIQTGAKTTADFFLSKTLAEWEDAGKVSLKVEARNIFSENYATIYGYPMPGRTFYAGLRYDF